MLHHLYHPRPHHPHRLCIRQTHCTRVPMVRHLVDFLSAYFNILFLFSHVPLLDGRLVLFDLRPSA